MQGAAECWDQRSQSQIWTLNDSWRTREQQVPLPIKLYSSLFVSPNCVPRIFSGLSMCGLVKPRPKSSPSMPDWGLPTESTPEARRNSFPPRVFYLVLFSGQAVRWYCIANLASWFWATALWLGFLALMCTLLCGNCLCYVVDGQQRLRNDSPSEVAALRQRANLPSGSPLSWGACASVQPAHFLFNHGSFGQISLKAMPFWLLPCIQRGLATYKGPFQTLGGPRSREQALQRNFPHACRHVHCSLHSCTVTAVKVRVPACAWQPFDPYMVEFEGTTMGPRSRIDKAAWSLSKV